jgi:amino acid adenylation domain-containing protein/non-ribosomal peptide synthase protein (TIGR01720 family)
MAESGSKAGTADDNLSKKRQTLLAMRALDQESEDDSQGDLVRRSREGPTSRFELSFAQQRLWFLAKLDPDSAAYNLSRAFTIEGRVDASFVRSAFAAVVRRHEALRTVFEEDEDGTPVQVVHETVSLPLTVVDLRSLEGATTAGEQRERIESQQARRPIDIERQLPVRVQLIHLPDERHRIVLTMHHIASDGWSMEILVRDFIRAYEAYRDGRTPSLDALDVQYADYAVWQRDAFGEDALAPQLDYWTDRLEDAPPLLSLPTDHPRPPVQSFEGDWVPTRIAPSTTQQLHSFVRSVKATPFMGLLAAFVALLSRYARQNDVLLGTPVSGRTRSEIEDVVGFFVNTLVIRSELDADTTFRTLLDHVRTRTLEAQANQDVPFERIVDALDLERDLSRHPLFQVAFSFGEVSMPGQDGPADPFGEEAEAASNAALSSGTSKFDLTLAVAENEDDGQYVGLFEYSTALFEASTIRQMASSYRQLLQAALDAPDRPLTQLRLLDRETATQVVKTGRGEDLPESPPEALHAFFERQARRTPDAAALSAPSGTLTYRALNRCANEVARDLMRRGVERGSQVGICAERSLLLPIGIIGILKAGAAYVPFDPEYPDQRLAYMAENAGVDVMLVQDAVASELPALNDVPTYRLGDYDLRRAAGDDALDRTPPTRVGPDDLAYVVYTSGSSGTPKGVMVTHRGIGDELRWRQSTLPLQADDRMLHNFSFSFDPSVWMLFWPLMAGAAVYVVPPDHPGDLPYLIDAIRQRRLTLLGLAPSTLDALLSLPGFDRCTSLRHVFSGGEALPGQLAAEASEILPEATLHNMYGLTEVAIDATHHVCNPDEDRPITPVGTPIANTSVYVLDASGHLVPPGMPGEIHVGGTGVARGYQGRPRLTAERFVPDPFATERGDEPGARMYRTGDLGRRLDDGAISFLGRVDRQVKLRGYRIEPNAVEVTLLEHDAVAETAVQVTDVNGSDQLVGYFSVEPDRSAPDAPELQQFLKQQIPEYMVPSRFVNLDEIPHTPNEKVDYDALPAPSAERTGTEGTYVAPRNEVEEKLCEVWKNVLGLDRVGIEDNFFTLGGDSIMSIQIVAQARQKQIVLTPQEMFQHQTVAALASVAEVGASVDAEQGLVTGEVPLLPAQIELLRRDLPSAHHWNRSSFFQVGTSTSPDVVRRTAAALTLHHDALRSRLTENGGGRRVVLDAPDAAQQTPATYVDLSGLPDRARRQVVERLAAQVQRSLHLADGPLFRMVYFATDESQRGRLLVTGHRFVTDDVSWEILLDDLQTLYGAAHQAEADRPSVQVLRDALPSKTTSVQEWGRRLVQRVEDAAPAGSVDGAEPAEAAAIGTYWLNRAGAEVDPIPISNGAPTQSGSGSPSSGSRDNGRPGDGASREREFARESSSVIAETANLVATETTTSRRLAPEATRTLTTVVPRDNRTRVTDVLLTALACALHEWGEVEAAWIDLPGYGRNVADDEVDLSRTVGQLASSYPVLLQSAADARDGDVEATFSSVRSELRTVPDDGLEYALLRFGAGPAPPIRRTLPDADVRFQYVGQNSDASDDAGLSAAPESAGPERHQQSPRTHVFDMRGLVENGRFRVECRHSTALHDAQDVDRFLDAYVDALHRVMDYVQSADAGSYTPDDFDLADLDEQDLTTIGDALDG